MAQKDVGNKIPIYKLKKTDEVMKYYDEWGEGNKYDKDMVEWNYTGPKETSEVLAKHHKNKDAKKEKLNVLKSLPSKFNANDLEVNQHMTKSADGTLVPYFIIHSKKIKHNSKTPTILYGYGGFERIRSSGIRKICIGL